MALYADAGPLYGMVCPSLISVSVTPGPYFFSAAKMCAQPSAATARSSFKEWDEQLDAVLDAYFEDGAEAAEESDAD